MTESAGGLYDLGDVERTLRRIVVGYRGLTVAWAVLLAVVVLSSDRAVPHQWVLFVEIAVISGWLAVLLWLNGRRPESIRSWWFLGIDWILAAGVLVADWWAGDVTLSLAGGYPLSAVAVAAYARGGAAALLSAGAMLATALYRRIALVGGPELGGIISDLAAWVFPGVLLGWAAGVIRTSDRRRRESEDALADERTERARAEERAEVAAHLHDSVLQTLALIQRSAGEGDRVRTLARRQERELRRWLYGADPVPEGGSFVGAVRALCDEFEVEHHVEVEFVAVGDTTMSDRIIPMLRAAREALTNAIHHAGVGSIDVYSEVADGEASLFVRDRGSGFDLARIPADRAGLRESIVGRMERAGGSAAVKTTRGRGTEIQLRIPIEEPQE